MPLFVLRRLAGLWEALIAFGHLWVHIPTPPPADRTDPTGPAPGHPERLCPELPPTNGNERCGRTSRAEPDDTRRDRRAAGRQEQAVHARPGRPSRGTGGRARHPLVRTVGDLLVLLPGAHQPASTPTCVRWCRGASISSSSAIAKSGGRCGCPPRPGPSGTRRCGRRRGRSRPPG
ncbi:DUF6059 family protein [Streptomyces bikiniensis]|uniref:DUF6059 family protein n=1 Tax=Streptomyces bikiniensis TaxID=1896 RepID=UPI001F1EDD3D|nr:DUF6059 family protein [Streptomyces bikiniensis]